MKNKKKIITLILGAMLLIGGGIFFYYWWEGKNYVATEDARIAANTVSVTPLISGKIVSWEVTEGDSVKAGQNLGWQDTTAMAGSSVVNPNALKQTGSLAVSKAEITAPISGKIIKSSVQMGQLASPGQTLAMIADTDDLYVSANIEETKIARLKPGQDVDIFIDALNGRKVKGKVDMLGQATVSTFSAISMQSSSGSFTKVTQLVPIKIRFPVSSDLPLVPGMSVVIKIHLNS